MKIMKNILSTNINPKVFFSVIIIVSLVSISLIVYAKTLTIGETGDILYIKSDVGIGTTNPGYKLDVSDGDINVSNVYRQAGTAGINITCSGGQILENPVVSGGIVTGGTCAVGGGGTQGPPGPQGPRGLQGIQGPQGPPAPSAICTYDGHTYSTGAICEVGSRSCKWPDTCGGVSCPSFGYRICYIAQKCQSSGGWSAWDTITDYPSCK